MVLGGQRYSGWYSEQNYQERFTAQKVYPTLADGVEVTTHADDWVLGSFVEIVPVNTITSDFHIHHVHVIKPTANGTYDCVLYCGTTEIGRFSFSRTEKKDDMEGIEIHTTLCDANSQVQAKLASENDASEDKVEIKLWYHEHS
ncbi:unnamed protein product [marine sediment metagenome]|uniref:Uncharacterized protein n=1 Tax=marine sediment metagenome TaxID=412755 RepID=X0ZA57_9ZZZZ